jgi:hypothetical protein
VLAPSPIPLVPMVGPSRRTTGPVVESSRSSIAFARVAENVPCTTPLHAVSRSLLSILRWMNCKLCFFCRYHVEIRALQGNSTLIFSPIEVYSLEFRALQGNSTWILQTCCRYYDKWKANCMSSFVITSNSARFKETLLGFFKRVVDNTINELQTVCLHSLSCRKNLRFTKCLPWFSVQFMCIHSNSARFKETLPWFSVQFMCIHSNSARFKETLPWFFKRVVDTTINELQTPLLLSLSRRKNLRFKETLPGFSNLLSILR